MKDKERQITEIWLNYLEESKTNTSLTPEEYLKRYPEYTKDLSALLAFTRIGQEILKQDLTPLIEKMKEPVWQKVQAKLKADKQIQPEIVELRKKAKEFYDAKRFSEAFKAYNRILGLKPDDIPAMGRKIDILVFHMKRFPEALKIAERILKIEPQNGHIWLMKTQICQQLRKLSLAFESLQKAQENMPNEKLFRFIARQYLIIGEKLSNKKDYLLAEKSLLKAIELSERINYTEGIEDGCLELFVVYLYLNNWKGQEEITHKILKLHQQLNKREELADDYFTLGTIALDLRSNAQVAKENFLKALPLFKEFNMVENIAWCYLKLGVIALKEGSLTSAKTHYLEAEKITQSLDNKELYLITQIDLSSVEGLMNDTESSIKRRKEIVKMEKKYLIKSTKKWFIMNYLELGAFYAAYGKMSLVQKMMENALRLSGKEKETTKEGLEIKITGEALNKILSRKRIQEQKEEPINLRLRNELFGSLAEQTEDKDTEK